MEHGEKLTADQKIQILDISKQIVFDSMAINKAEEIEKTYKSLRDLIANDADHQAAQ